MVQKKKYICKGVYTNTEQRKRMIKQMGDKMLIIGESGWSVCGSSLYYYNFSVNLKLPQNKKLKKRMQF